ncbi:ABC transporter substrate-binding protein [Bacillus sp. IITD106]|nr:ABC transporter substrate-binding protein [Bacillus sp. IITD106]
MRKFLILMVLSLIVSAVMTGCSSVNNANGSNNKKVTWWIPNWDEEEAKEIVKKFEEENKDIKVELSILTWDTMENKIRVALETGEVPDVITELESRIGNYASEGFLTELDSYFEKSLDKNDFISSAIDINSYEGKIYGLPFRHDGAGVLYNKTMFKEAGLDPDNFPKTREEYLAAAEKLTKDTNGDGKIDQYGIGLQLGNQDNALVRYLQMLYSLGGELLNEDRTQSMLDSPEALKAMEELTNEVKNGLAPKSSMELDNTGLRDLFINEKVAMYVGGQFDIEPIQNGNPSIELGTALIPGFDGMGTTTVDGFSLIMPEKGKNKDATWKLMEYIAKPENMAKLTDTFPATNRALKDPKFEDPLLQPFAQQLESGKAKPGYKEFPEITKIIYRYMQLIILDDMDVELAMSKIHEEVSSLLK